MAYPTWYNEEQKRLQALHEQVENKERTKTQIQNEVDFKNGQIAQLESEIEDINREISAPKLPLLLFYNIKFLDTTGNGHSRFIHERIYYYANTDTVDTVTNIFTLENRSQSLLPGTVDLTVAFSRMGASDIEKITDGIKATMSHLLETTKVSSWTHMGQLLAAYYDPKSE
jgi:predicted RNase H-like nuclease (RuvC/YqgF family)